MKKPILILFFFLLFFASYAQTIETFTTEETTTWVAPEGVTSISVLVVGGGGSGGNHTTTNANGGGGGGGVVYEESYTVVPGDSYTVTVGSGGAAICNGCSSVGNNGENSVFGTLTAIGGGGGGATANGPGADGGSGGGAAYDYASGASTQTGGFGSAGGATTVTWTGAGGGGAGSAGNVGGIASPGGNGGAGYESNITGTAVKYAGGGGGGGNSSERSGDGYDGGGRGSGTTTEYNFAQYVEEVNATTGGSGTPDAIPNTGGGGGGGSYWSPNVGWTTGSGAGGSGIVIISYTMPNIAPTFTSTPITAIDAGDTYSYTITTDDANGDQIAVTAPTKPAWLSLAADAGGDVTTLAGSGSGGSTDANGKSASFLQPYGAVVDASGNVYVADWSNHKIRKIAPNGDVTTLAGSGSAGSTDANGISASFNLPIGVDVDASGNVYVADWLNHKIRKIAPNGDVTTLAGSGSAGSADANGASASFNFPAGIAVDVSGNVYVADQSNRKIRRILSNGDVSTLAGSGNQGSTDANGTSASFNQPTGVAVDAAGNVYVVDQPNHNIRKITPNGDVTTLAGSGSAGSTDANGASASFNQPRGIAVDDSGNVYVADNSNHKIRRIAPNGDVTTLAGTGSIGSTDANGASASFNGPKGVAVDVSGNVFVADAGNNKIRKISAASLQLTGDATGNGGSHPVVLEANDGNGGVTEQSFTVVVSDVPAVTTSAATSITAISSTLNGEVTSDGEATITERGFVYSLTTTDATPTVGESSGSDVTKVVVSGTTGTFSEVLTGLTTSASYSFAAYATNNVGTTEGSVLTFTPENIAPTFTSTPITAIDAGDTYNYTITTEDVNGDNVTVTASTKPAWLSLVTNYNVTTMAGSGSAGSTNGTGASASFNFPYGVAVDALGNVYVADYFNHLIRKITSGGVVTTLAGSGSAGNTDANGTSASFNYPIRVAVDASGNVYVADVFNHKIRKIAPNGDVTTLAGSGSQGNTNATGTSASFKSPHGVAVDASGNVYVADWGNHLIRKITPSGDVTTLAGTGSAGSIDANSTSASFNQPDDVSVDASGNVYVADAFNHKIRKITPSGVVTTLAGSGSAGSIDANGTSASFSAPIGVAVDESGNVYVADGGHIIRKIALNGDVSTLVGSGSAGSTDGNSVSATFDTPADVAVDASGNVYVADLQNHKIRKISDPSIHLTGNTTGNTGSHSVVLEANDGNGGITQQSFTVVVSAVSPTVTSVAATSITAISATLNGEVTSDGEATITERGFVYSLTSVDATPTVAESSGSDVTKVVVTGTTGAFNEALSSLTASTDYSFVAYATNSLGTTEGSVLTFTTSALTAPTITFENINRVYGDEDFALAATSNSAGVISYSIEGEAKGASLSGTNNEDVSLGDAGSLTIRATQAADDIYSSTTKDITLTVAAKATTVTADAGQTKVLDAADPTFAYSVTTGELESGDSFTGSLSRAAGEDVGLYAITVGTLSAGANYDLTYVGADFRIVLAGDTNGDGTIGNDEVVGDTNGDGSIGDGEVAGDGNGDGQIGGDETAGDQNGDEIIDGDEIAGDVDGDGEIGEDETTGDTNGDGVIGDGEVEGDTNGDGVIGEGEQEGDTSGDGVLDCEELTALGQAVSNAVEVNGFTLSAEAEGLAYQWIDCSSGQAISGATAREFLPSGSGSYSVEIVNDGCTVTSECREVTLLSSSDMSQQLTVYPNPVRGKAVLEAGRKLQKVKIYITDLSGKVVWMVSDFTGTRVEIPFSDLARGLYLINVRDEQGAKTLKIFRE